MSVGEGALISPLGYLSVGRETTLGTYNTCTAGIDTVSTSLKTGQEGKILEQIERSRNMSKRIQMGKVVEGDVEAYFYSSQDSCVHILANAFGGSTITSATATGETVGGLALEHTIPLGNNDGAYPSLCLNERKGEASGGMVFEYHGARVNELALSGEIDEALKMNASFICMNSTMSSNDVESALTFSSADPLSFVNGRISVESTFASLTSSSYWHVQSFEFTVNNNLKSDSESRRIGSDVLQVLPLGKQDLTLNMTIRFDTTTAYDAMLAASKFSAEFEFTANTITGSVAREGLKIQIPELYVNEAGLPETGGPDEVLVSEVSWHIVRDDSSATGYSARAIVTNTTSSY